MPGGLMAQFHPPGSFANKDKVGSKLGPPAPGSRLQKAHCRAAASRRAQKRPPGAAVKPEGQGGWGQGLESSLWADMETAPTRHPGQPEGVSPSGNRTLAEWGTPLAREQTSGSQA